MVNKRKIAKKLAWFFLRHDRGLGLLSFIERFVKNTIYLMGGGFFMVNLIGIKFNIILAPIIALSYSIICYFVGWLDYKIGFWKIQNEIGSNELNPFFKQMDKKIDDIIDKLTIEKNDIK